MLHPSVRVEWTEEWHGTPWDISYAWGRAYNHGGGRSVTAIRTRSSATLSKTIRDAALLDNIGKV